VKIEQVIKTGGIVCYRLKELYSIRDQHELRPTNNIARVLQQPVERKQTMATKPTNSSR